MELQLNLRNFQQSKQSWTLLITVYLSFAWYIQITTAAKPDDNVKPNIVIIMADDMGFDDVSFRGSNRFLTPNIDALAYSGIVLANLYTHAMCTPSRAALLTGKYPINTGMQHYVIVNEQPWSLPTNETTISQLFQKNGYFTSLIGKWHLGMSRKAYTPTQRGFDQHFGYLGAYIDYYDQTLYSPDKNYSRGHDFRNNLEISHQHIGKYTTDVLTEAAVSLITQHNVTKKPLFMILSHLAPHSGNEDAPLQAPLKEIEKFAYIKDTNKRIYAAMMSKLDESVGQVVEALARKNILQNTIILFLSDNGGATEGQHSTTASNYPLRGQKNTPWEGALRSSAAIWSTQFEKLGTLCKLQMHITDLLPTLAAAADIQIDADHLAKLDGLNLWPALKYGYDSVEREIVHNIDERIPYASYTKGKFKFVNGTTQAGEANGWLGTRAVNKDEEDPRAAKYEQLIHNTSVWQILNGLNNNSNPNWSKNITQLRLAATVICKFENSSLGSPCDPLTAPCFFDIEQDPCEQDNLFEKYKNSKTLHNMLVNVEQYRRRAHVPNNKPPDPNCDPKFHHNEWTWWEDADQENSLALQIKPVMHLSFILMLFLLVVENTTEHLLGQISSKKEIEGLPVVIETGLGKHPIPLPFRSKPNESGSLYTISSKRVRWHAFYQEKVVFTTHWIRILMQFVGRVLVAYFKDFTQRKRIP